MNDQSPDNPYTPPLTKADSRLRGQSRVPTLLLGIVIFTLFVRGGFALPELYGGVAASKQLSAAILARQIIYVSSAFFGGTFLLFANPMGWRAALVHWCWDLTCTAGTILTTESLGWNVSMSNRPLTLLLLLFVSAVLPFAAVGILLWTPIMLKCFGNADRRGEKLGLAVACCVLSAFSCIG